MTAFVPFPGLTGPHAQTLAGALYRPGTACQPRREWLELNDGERIGLDFLDSQAERTVLVLHGLSGTSGSPLVRSTMALSHALPARVVGMNFRGALGCPSRPRLYHAGRSDDLDHVAEHLMARFGPRLAVVGFSLGGNITLKWLGERGDSLPSEVMGCAACTPYDLGNCARELEKSCVSRLYRWYLVRRLKARVKELLACFPGVLDWERIRHVRTLTEFDREVTARLNGFLDEEDYWRQSSSLYQLARIRRRTLLLNAADDPFLAPGDLPYELALANPSLELEVTEHGGHLGFIGPGWTPWIEHRVARFLADGS